ncbi:MAG TPA: glycosyltransferase family 39 protein [Vicinamibacterales bacterium]|nr:glycosyltransferase family 39 protein [Vicinamibacterales bacterium]
MNAGADLSRGLFGWSLIAILAIAALLRGLFPAADPPWNPAVGIVWHDEGAWVHNARNRALFGAWSLDKWNPMYIAPVFTGLEFASFRWFGVGVRQARLVPEFCGFAAVCLLALGVKRIAGRLAGLCAAALLGTNYFYVMWDRTALMEGPMAAFMVASWYGYTRADDNPRWGIVASACALLAFFTKAAAAFFVAAIALDALTTLLTRGKSQHSIRHTRLALWTLGGLAVFGVVALAAFVLPNWSDYRFYNWQMSVTRKPSYDFKSLLDRATWLPLQDAFTRTWFIMAIAMTHAAGLIARWRTLRSGERLLVWWVVLGAAELILHDAGNERRFVFFIPAFVALASLALGRLQILPREVEETPRARAILALPFVLYGAYLVFGAFVRIAFLREISPNVRIAASLAIVFGAVLLSTWPRLPRSLSAPIPRRGAVLLLVLLSAGNLIQYLQWAVGRTYKNYEASRELGRLLPPGTLVHGKLANGLALENNIRPIFVGRGFGNYDDRKSRDDVRYILTYIAPSLGYESQAHNPIIRDVIDAYPDHRIVATFDVRETATGHDRAALIDKFGGGRQNLPSGRAKD